VKRKRQRPSPGWSTAHATWFLGYATFVLIIVTLIGH